MPRTLIRHGQQLFLTVPVERFVVLLGFVPALFQLLEDGNLVIRHEVQAVAAEVPQQVARNQVGDLGIAVEGTFTMEAVAKQI